MPNPDLDKLARGLTEAQRCVVNSSPVIRGKRNGLFWAHNDANLLADMSHLGLCKMPFIDQWGISAWQFVARIRPAGMFLQIYIQRNGQ